jgi:radical SAM protein with 4Fe4S-binding SPASM domain
MSDSESKTICAVPWMHLNFEPNGKVVPCCLTSAHNYFAGDLNKDSIEEIWNSKNMRKLRKEMIDGVEPAICNKCFDREKVTGISGRTHHNRNFPEVIEAIPEITEEDGKCTTMDLKYWDFRFSNLCNFKCRSCGPRYSSAWVPDAKKLGWISEQEKVWHIKETEKITNVDFLRASVDKVKTIYFAGGEPLMMPEHWAILDMLVEAKRFDVKIQYNTNMSLLGYNKKKVLDYWKQWDFGMIEVWPSIDELNERAELIRAGTVWSKVEANIKEVAKYPNIIMRPGLTIGAWNVFRIPEIVDELVALGCIRQHEYMNHNNWFVNLLETPVHYHVSIWPDKQRQIIIDHLREWIAEFNAQHNTDIQPIMDHIISELEKPWNQQAAERFVDISNEVDKVRGENIYEVIPEMDIIRKATLK